MKEQALLTKVLIFIDRGTARSVKDIADKLVTSPDLVYHILMNLEQMGFLKSLNPSQSPEGCKGCRGNCSLCVSSPRLWELTEKGRKKVKFAMSRE